MIPAAATVPSPRTASTVPSPRTGPSIPIIENIHNIRLFLNNYRLLLPCPERDPRDNNNHEHQKNYTDHSYLGAILPLRAKSHHDLAHDILTPHNCTVVQNTNP
jgi:hypothetical protein